MTDSTQAAREAFEAWWRKTERYEPRYAFLAGVEWNASRSTPTAVAPRRVVIVCQECDCEQMLGGCVDCRAAQAAAGRSPHGPRPVAETPMRETLQAAAALLREAGWRVEEPKCKRCGGSEWVGGGYGYLKYPCPTCNGTGKREVGE